MTPTGSQTVTGEQFIFADEDRIAAAAADVMEELSRIDGDEFRQLPATVQDALIAFDEACEIPAVFMDDSWGIVHQFGG
jgi:hypothetical protein